MKSKIISFVLLLSMLLTIIPVYASGGISNTETEQSSEFPEIVCEEIKENGYIRRKSNEEPDLYTFVFANDDGTETMRVFSHPVKYVNSDGKVNDISLALKENDGVYAPESHGVICSFPKNLNEGISIIIDGCEVTTVPLFTDDISASFDSEKNVVRYDLDSKTSIEYYLTYTGYEEDIVINEYTGVSGYTFKVMTGGLKLVVIDDIPCLINSDGKCCAHFGDVYIYSEDNTTNAFGTISIESIKNNEEYNVTINVDADFLRNASYPIRIDPSVELTYDHNGEGAIEDVTINENVTFDGTSGSLYVGRHTAGSLSRALMRFPNLVMPVTNPDHIVSASVEIRDLMCQDDEDMSIECYTYKKTAPSWSESGTTTWTSVGSDYLGDYLSSHTISYGCGNVQSHRYGYDITALAKAWVSGTQSPSKGIVFKATDAFEAQTGSNINYWYKTFSSYNRNGNNKPSLTITYSGGDGWGNYWYNATTISLNNTYSGSINSTADIDMFKFVAPDAGYYRFETTGSLDTKSYLYSLGGTTLTQLAYNDDYDYPDNGRNSLIYYKLSANQTVYWAVRGYGSNTGNYSVRISKSTAFIYGYNWDINTLQDNNIQKPYLTALGFTANDKTANYNMFTTTNSVTGRKEPNHELFIYNGHGDVGCIQLPIGDIYSDAIGTKSFSSNLIALWFCCQSANGNATYESMMQASVNEGARSAFGYTVDVDDDGARVFGKYFVKALTQGATMSEAKEYARTHLVTDMPSMATAIDSPLNNAIAGSESTKLVTDLTFSMNGDAVSSNNDIILNGEDYKEVRYDDLTLYLFTIDGFETNAIYYIINENCFAPSVTFDKTDIESAKQLIDKYGKVSTSKIDLDDNTVINDVRRVVYKFGDNIRILDIFSISTTEKGRNSFYEVYVDVETGKVFYDYDLLKQEMLSLKNGSDKKITEKTDVLPKELAIVNLNMKYDISNTTKEVGGLSFNFLTINGIITNSFTWEAFGTTFATKVKFTENDIVESARLIDCINESYKYIPSDSEKVENITRQIIKDGENNLGVFDIYELFIKGDDVCNYMKKVYVNVVTGESSEEISALRK